MTHSSVPDPVAIVDSMEAVEFDVDGDRFRATFDDERDSLCLAVVAVIAVATDRDPAELPPLNEYIDTDALNAVFSTTPGAGRRTGRISFTYEGFALTVGTDGTIEASPVSAGSSPE